MECVACWSGWLSWGLAVLAFILGGWLGMLIMCLLFAGREDHRAEDPCARIRDLDS